ncbi:cytomegalovirus gH-receptor family protein [Purpureocillium lavendulum]|uniref:Cytomegalovirus gH-receptor family protein n=1 Tax=Purpureocillium lavendulum TaxID=1247861 RepID=A0AB34FI30_9HYPO|nr:cytomegalovirus gH-receptor family protein [Purpureocillium lavendulum]
MAASADTIHPQHASSHPSPVEPAKGGRGGGPTTTTATTTTNGANGTNCDAHDNARGLATPIHGARRTTSPGRGRSQSSTQPRPVRADKDHAAAADDDRSEHAPSSSRKRGASGSVKKTLSHDNVQKLSAADMQELTSSPDSLPIAPAPQRLSIDQELASTSIEQREDLRQFARQLYRDADAPANGGVAVESRAGRGYWKLDDAARRPLHAPRTVSTPPTTRIQPADGTPYSTSPRRFSFNPAPRPPPLSLNGDGANGFLPGHMPPPAIQSASPILGTQPLPPVPSPARGSRPPSPIPAMIPLPPMSLPTHLQLELAAQRPSPLYIHHSHSNDIPYESYSEKFERLKNVLLLPPYLERVLNFGALACLDAWLYTFTILPVRFIMALAILIRWWAYVIGKETAWLVGYVWPSNASERDRSRSRSRVRETYADRDLQTPNARERHQHTRKELHADSTGEPLKSPVSARDPGPKTGTFRHRRTRSTPSSLSAFHKADLLQGAVIICSSLALMTLDASRMYHFIRAQSAIKLYVIYNILEVGDRLLSALGQDILECLFSSETLSRNASGRSKVLLPLGMFMLALVYNCLHSIALYYQVITLNVAVNSYSNALLTLLLSNQFVEIKSTVFKRFEKDNLFQLTCADIVERFHLWVMLLIIGMRNVVEVGGLSVPGAGLDSTYDEAGPVPLHPPSILPHSFTVLPSWIMSGEVLSPFLIVVGSEMLVDTIKHAYVTKFNNIKPTFYSRTLDILCKDYYTNAFVTPSLTRRLGLAVIPLSCLFIRASIQTYHMFLSTHIPMPIPQSTQTSLTEESATPSSPAMMAALNRFDSLIRDSLGRATYGYPYGSPLNSRSWYAWTSDDLIAALTMVVVFFIAFLVLLILKLLLGMVLLKYARSRYVKMKHKEQLVARGVAAPESFDASGRRVGGRGDVEVSDDKQRWIHADKTEGLRGGKGPGGKRPGGAGDDGGGSGGGKPKKVEGEYQGVFRYEMVAKRIW